MHQESSKRILLVGATGYAGSQLANYLLRETEATLVLAGRSKTKLDDLYSDFRQEGYGDRVEFFELDAANIDSAALCDFDLLVNATGKGPHNAALIQACLDRRADWIDMQMTNELENPQPAIRQSIEKAGSCFVIQAGFHPGMVAPLVRYAGLQMDVMNSAIVGSVIRDEAGLPFTSAYSELVAAFRNYKGEMYTDGQWQKLGYIEYPKLEFEYGFGESRTYPMELAELRRLPESMPELKYTGFFVAGFNWFADYLVTPLIMLSGSIAPRPTAALLGRLLSWSTKRFTNPPFGTVLQVDASGQRDGRSVKTRISLFHDDMYAMTVVPTVAMIKQMLSGQVKSGIHLMGLCCDPMQLLEDIEHMDVAVTRRFSLRSI